MKFESDLAIRYSLVFLAALFGSYLYYVLLPVTLLPVSLVLSLFYSLSVQGSSILISGKSIEIIRACVGASAIILLLILNLATPSIRPKERPKIFAFGLILFLLFNWSRIVILSVLFVNDFSSFNQIHLFTWYFVSTIAVATIWIISVHLFRIKEIPFLSDLKELSSHLKN